MILDEINIHLSFSRYECTLVAFLSLALSSIISHNYKLGTIVCISLLSSFLLVAADGESSLIKMFRAINTRKTQKIQKKLA